MVDQILCQGTIPTRYAALVFLENHRLCLPAVRRLTRSYNRHVRELAEQVSEKFPVREVNSPGV